MIMITLGGMSRPRMDELAMIAVAYPRGYPLEAISGMSSGPVAATPVRPLPDMAPIRAQQTTATTPSPPRIRPTNAFTKRSRLAAMPLSLMMLPAKTNKGMHSRTGFASCEKPHIMVPFMVASPIRVMTIKAPPKQ
jgi:hypothetical protein